MLQINIVFLQDIVHTISDKVHDMIDTIKGRHPDEPDVQGKVIKLPDGSSPPEQTQKTADAMAEDIGKDRNKPPVEKPENEPGH